MSKFTLALPYGHARTAPGASPATLRALAGLRRVLLGQDAYRRGLKRIFGEMPLPDRKDALSYQHALLDQYSIGVLTIIWRESEHVTDADLAAAGTGRDYSPERPLNCHSLATGLAEGKADLGRTQKRVNGIVAAAAAYGLVERVRDEGARHYDLRGTSRLHDLMLRAGGLLRGTED